LAATISRAATPVGGPCRPNPSRPSNDQVGRREHEWAVVGNGLQQRQAQRGQRPDLMGGGALERLRVMTEPNRHLRAPGVQETGGHHPIAAVAAASGQNRHMVASHSSLPEALARPDGHGLPGQLHELEHINAEFQGHDPIDV